jgi:thiosulfate/3-mercaptopyruvate sulfurtransferase
MLLGGCAGSVPQPEAAPPPAILNDTLVSAQWLQQHLNTPGLVVLDCSVLIEMDDSGGFRPVSGRTAYAEGHIPTAGFADLMSDLSRADSDIGFAVPAPEQFAAAMSALGVSDDSSVVLYDRTNSAWAARVWWMLRWIGFDRAALLDGGLQAWRDENLPLSTEPASYSAGTLGIDLRPQLIAERDDVRDAVGRDDIVLIDALPEAHFRGQMNMYGRPGHIPGARNVPSSSLLDDTGKYRSSEELRALFGDRRDNRTITYCGGGIAASADAFVLTRLGYTDVAVYAASLQEWAADPDNPLQTEPTPAPTTRDSPPSR